MKNIKFLITVIAITSLCWSCKKNEPTPEPPTTTTTSTTTTPDTTTTTTNTTPPSATGGDCTFVQVDSDMDGLIDDGERTLMDDCTLNAFTTIAEIEDNLIGEWELIGHGEGWVPKLSQPCAYITFTADEMTFEFTNGYVDTITVHNWEIEELTNLAGVDYFYLNTNAMDYNHGLHITQFCTDYMYGDATPLDGTMYLFEKVD